MLSPSTKRKLRDIHQELTYVNIYLAAAVERGSPMKSKEIEDLEKKLHKQIARIYTILDPPHRKS